MDTSKIIRGVVSNGRYTVTAPIVKEDYGLYLQIEGVELPETYQVDFSNSENSGTSVTMIGNADGVLIPRQFIDTGKDIFAFLYHVGANYGRTVYKFRIPNKVRPDRTSEQPTPEEQSVIDQAISALNTAVAQTAQDVVDAEASAQAAGYDADRAEEARSASLDYAEQAEASATSAEQSATASANSASASANSASQSAQIKTDVEDLVDDAQGYANSAQQSASQASASEQGCARAVLDAASAAAIARARAEEANGYAQTASTKASEASTSAQTASTKATEASQSASQALTYKNDAEQAKTNSQAAQGLAESARDTAVSAKTDAQGYAEDAQASAESISASASQIAQNTADILKAFPTDSASGSIASFHDGADNIPLKSLIVNIDPVQDTSSGDPSPENICPISGWTSVDVEQRGVNLLNNALNAWKMSRNYIWQESVVPKNTRASMYLEDKDTSVDMTGCYIGFCYDNLTDLTSSPTKFRWIVLNGNIQANKSNSVAPFGDTFGDTLCEHVFVYPKSTETLNKIFSRWNVMVELDTTATPYSPYTGRSLTINLGQTVYGGKLDVLSGELVVDRAMVDLGTLNWSYNTTYSFFWTSSLNKANGLDNAIYSMYAYGGWWTSWTDKDYVWCGNLHNKNIAIKDTRYTDTVSFKSAITGQTLVYELANPITIQLTPNQVNSLLGVNNIWADTGDTTAEYRADTKLYIQKKIAEALASLT